MAISNRSVYDSPRKSPYSFEHCDSDMERMMMAKLERDPEVVRWQKRHSVSIPWIDAQGRKCNYRPDFLVEYADGRKEIIEVKNPALIDSPAVQRKRSAAEAWCAARRMAYRIATLE